MIKITIGILIAVFDRRLRMKIFKVEIIVWLIKENWNKMAADCQWYSR